MGFGSNQYASNTSRLGAGGGGHVHLNTNTTYPTNAPAHRLVDKTSKTNAPTLSFNS